MCLEFQSFRSYFRSLLHFELIFVCAVRVQFHSLHVDGQFSWHAFVEEAVFSLLCVLGTLVKDHLTAYAWIYFWAPRSVPLVCLSVFILVHTFLVTTAL